MKKKRVQLGDLVKVKSKAKCLKKYKGLIGKTIRYDETSALLPWTVYFPDLHESEEFSSNELKIVQESKESILNRKIQALVRALNDLQIPVEIKSK